MKSCLARIGITGHRMGEESAPVVSLRVLTQIIVHMGLKPI